MENSVINEEAKEVKVEKDIRPKYKLDELLASKKYRHKQDLLVALLDADKAYTTEQVDKLIESYLNKEVK